MTDSVLRSSEAFGGTPFADVCHSVKATAQRVRRVSAGQDICREGIIPHHVHFVRQGWACRYKALADGRRQILALLLPGNICEHDLGGCGEMDHSIAAVTDTSVLQVDRTDLEFMVRTDPGISRAVWRETLLALSMQREFSVSLGRRSAAERTAHLACETYFRLCRAGLAGEGACDFPLTQAELGDMIGLSTVHVNRMLMRLRSMGLMTLVKGRLIITDMEGLQRFAHFDPHYLQLGPEPISDEAERCLH